MLDFILTSGDQAIFNPNFGQAIVVVLPGFVIGSGKATINHRTICVEGDEKNIIVFGCAYTKPPLHIISGMGTLSITSLNADHRASNVKSKGNFVLLKGTTFVAKFQVISPALQSPPIPPKPDTTLQYSGTGTFSTTNVRAQILEQKDL